MAHSEIRIPFSEIKDPDKITEVNRRKFAEHGLNMHLHEVDGLEDDHKSQTRILKVRNRKYFDLGRGKK